MDTPKTGKALAVKKSQPLAKLGSLTPEQVDLVKATVAKGATDDELKMFLYVANRTGLDPFVRQIHFVKRRQWDDATKSYKEVGTIQTGIDGYRVAAVRTGEHAGTDDAVFEEANSRPTKATVTAYRIVKAQRYAFAATARWDEYVQISSKTNEPMGLWKKMPYTMLAKCAEALALRKAFPELLSGIYTNEEMQQADQPATAETPPVQDDAARGLREAIETSITVNGWDRAKVEDFTTKKYGGSIQSLPKEKLELVLEDMNKKAEIESKAKAEKAEEEEAGPSDYLKLANECKSQESADALISIMKDEAATEAKKSAIKGILESKGFRI